MADTRRLLRQSSGVPRLAPSVDSSVQRAFDAVTHDLDQIRASINSMNSSSQSFFDSLGRLTFSVGTSGFRTTVPSNASTAGFTFIDAVNTRSGDYIAYVHETTGSTLFRLRASGGPSLIVGGGGASNNTKITATGFVIGTNSTGTAAGVFSLTTAGAISGGPEFTSAAGSSIAFAPNAGSVMALELDGTYPLAVWDLVGFVPAAFVTAAFRYATVTEKFGLFQATNSRWIKIEGLPGGRLKFDDNSGGTEPTD